MTITMPELDTATAAKAATAPRATSRQNREQELRRLMSEHLSDTVEIAALQQRLLYSLTRGVAMDGLHYHHEDLDLDIQVGEQSVHSCGYRLLFTDEYLGEITFKRKRRFTEKELQLIESVIPMLLKPLRDSLKSQQETDA
jgi:hypothetical protein